jgi:hypothetical protein
MHLESVPLMGADMQRHVDAMPGGWLGRNWLWPVNSRLLPNLRAFSRFRAPGAWVERPPPLGRLGNLEIRLA